MAIWTVSLGAATATGWPEVRRVRSDALPEHTRYRDDGCDIHPHCLTCPLPRCRYDEPGGLRSLVNAHRDRQIVEMRLRGVPVDDLAGRFGISRRTVFRILSMKEAQYASGNGAGDANAGVHRANGGGGVAAVPVRAGVTGV
ncbi:MAG TPA: helix-turn-helix domain-containing protein [Dehalococcoidia bacterium]|nr:helix-turn-helix domain-containing protein [Dehalococcoidia bacterium]